MFNSPANAAFIKPFKQDFARAPQLADMQKRLRDNRAAPILATSPAMREINLATSIEEMK